MIANPSTFDFSKFTPAQLELMQGGQQSDFDRLNALKPNLENSMSIKAPLMPTAQPYGSVTMPAGFNVANLPKPTTQTVAPAYSEYDPMQPLYAAQSSQPKLLNGAQQPVAATGPAMTLPVGFDTRNFESQSPMAMSQAAPTTNALPPPMAAGAIPTSSNIDPAIQPYLGYGLTEAQRLYQAGGPQYYGGQTYVSPSTTTQTALQALETRAKLGNPLLQSAQNQLQSTVSGEFLGGNPFFQGAFAPAAKAAESQFKQTLGDVAGKASLAGRYGSGAMGSLQDRATGAFSQSLANTAGQLAYQNYDAERARQQAATLASPAMAGADYQDIQQLINAGQAREGYTGQQTQADIQRFNFLQNQPQQNLQTYLQSVYGNPTARMQQQQAAAGPSDLQNLLGTAATLAGIEGKTNWLSKGWNILTGP
jgi:hypothetical protein